jgi:hypothetical protein
MNKYKFRIVISRFISFNIGVYRAFYTQGALADYLSVRQATVSSWVHKNSCIDAFTFICLLLAFADKGKKNVRQVFSDFLDLYNEVLIKNYDEA